MNKLVAAVVTALLAPLLVFTLGWTPSRPDPCLTAAVAPADGETGNWIVPVADTGGALQVRIATWNTDAANSTGNVVAGIRRLTRAADVIGVQELAPEVRRRAVDRALPAGWAVSVGDDAIPVYFNRARFDLLAQGSDKLFGPTTVESGVARTTVGPKSIQGLQLRDRRTGAVFSILNHHLVPNIDKGGWPDPAKPQRVALAAQQLDAAFGLAARLRSSGPVAITSDWNIDATADAEHQDPAFVHARAAAAGMQSDQAVLGRSIEPTHSNRRIDYVVATTDTVDFQARRIAGRGGSDHAPVVVNLVRRQTTASSSAAAPAANLPAQIDAAGIVLQSDRIRTAAAFIAAGKAAGVPPEGWVVALAAGLQESGLDATLTEEQSDRDSAGPLQQRRPWGPLRDRQDPYTAASMFYTGGPGGQDGLLDIPGWQQMPVTAAAQAVQVSAFPDAYADDEPAARALVQQLGGITAGTGPAGCVGDVLGAGVGSCPATGLAAEVGLTADALQVLRCGEERFPAVDTYHGVGSRPGNATSDHPAGNGVDFMVSNLPDYRSGVGSAYGWRLARWMQANHQALGVKYVIFANRIWSTQRTDEGWRLYNRGSGDTALHYDHVHVSTFGDRGTGLTSSGAAATDAWAIPLAAGSYTIGTRFGVRGPRWASGAHTGQDFPAAIGTPVRAAAAGRVVEAEHAGPYGNHVVVQVDAKTKIYYAHLAHRDLEAGATVQAGQLVGGVGATGNVSGPHLHFEVRVGGRPVDPLPLITSGAS